MENTPKTWKDPQNGVAAGTGLRGGACEFGRKLLQGWRCDDTTTRTAFCASHCGDGAVWGTELQGRGSLDFTAGTALSATELQERAPPSGTIITRVQTRE